MRAIVRDDERDPRGRALVAAIWRRRGLWDPAKARERAAAILDWVQRNVIYIHERRETFTRPRRMIEPAWRFGDCDEFTTFLAWLFESAGYATNMIAMGWGGRYRHVYLEVALPPGGGAAREWLAAEGTRRVPLGWSPLAQRRRLTAVT